MAGIITGRTKVFGIIGYPVAHSLSPAMHNAAFRVTGYPGVYVPFPTRPETLPAALSGLKALGINGVSVTVPHKVAVMDLLDEIDPLARRIGAVNTIVTSPKGLKGLNTDWLGALKAIEEVIDPRGRRVLILGAGGAARAIAYGLSEAGAEVVILNRTRSKAEALAREIGAVAGDLEEMVHLSAEILIQTTTVGLEEDRSLVPREVLSQFKVVMDIVYSPLKTRLLKEAEAAGCQTIDGLSMLVYQGAAQFELWTEEKAPIEIMRKAALDALVGKG
ncbi:shikimate dehydrogenase [Thermosulfuriphilus sp.]